MSTKGAFSKVSRRMWNDEKFRRLSSPPPNGQSLWQRLLTGPELSPIPGLFQAWEAGLAQAMRWPLEGFRDAFAEVKREGLAEADWEVGLVWVPNAIEHNSPNSLNVVRGWRKTWAELPECELKVSAYRRLKAYVDALSDAFAEAFAKACPMPSAMATPKPSPLICSPAPAPALALDREGVQGEGSPPAPRSLKAALEIPVTERARLVAANPHDGEYLEPRCWPEVVAVAAALAEATGQPSHARLGAYGRDAGVRAVVGLLADGFEADELVAVARSVAKSEWWRKGKRGLSSLTPEVVRRALDTTTPKVDARTVRQGDHGRTGLENAEFIE